jgi:hypothetical protein
MGFLVVTMTAETGKRRARRRVASATPTPAAEL